MLRPPPSDSIASVHLDFIRGVAAVLVVLGHARRLLVVDPSELPRVALWQKAFYFVTSLGAPAVIVFFVLSGFLVGSSVVRAFQDDRWSWRQYAAARVSPIYTVLIPAVLIGAGLDAVGTHWLPQSAMYAGRALNHMISGRIIDTVDAPTIGGNLLNLQTIIVPTVGSNVALWSLANEWWYYALFPLAACAVAYRRSPSRAVGYGVAFAGVFAMLPTAIRWSFAIWLLGVVITTLPRVRGNYFRILLCLTALIAHAVLGFAVKNDWWLATVPYGQGVLAAALVYLICCLGTRPAPRFYAAAARGLSSISFTLYVFHLPCLALLIAALSGRTGRTTLGPGVIALVIGFTTLAVICAALFWFLFERQTTTVRRWLSRAFGVNAVEKRPTSGASSFR